MGSSAVAFLASYPPRECGIATFTGDLHQAIVAERGQVAGVIALQEAGADRRYGREVLTTLRADDPRDYRRVAQVLRSAGVGVLNVQHEYGLYGGADGAMLFELLDATPLPVVTTMHTVLTHPGPRRADLTRRLCARSCAVVGLARTAVALLEDVYRADPRRLHHIPHGIPTVVRAPGTRRKAKVALGQSGRKLVSTFGLIGPSKGIEYVIRALPGVVDAHPDLTYAVLGQTHPGERRSRGEGYRRSLEALVGDLGLRDHVVFVDRYLDPAELVQWLLASDVYVMPYLDPEQVVSGTLAYAVGCGKAVIATAFPYARELLADGRGVVVPFRDAGAIRDRLRWLMDDRAALQVMEERAYAYSRDMRWPNVGRAYADLFARVAARDTARIA